MFDVGFWELILVFGLGLIILGPERLPRVAAQVGRWVARARRTANQLRRQLEMEIKLDDPPTTYKRPKPPPAASTPPTPEEDTTVTNDAATHAPVAEDATPEDAALDDSDSSDKHVKD